MPSVEVVCIGQKTPTDFSALPLAVEAENRLVSHRSPEPLFQTDFDSITGCIYHFGGPHLRDPNVGGAYTAAELLVEWWDVILFKPQYVAHVDTILRALLAASPDGALLFTSDYQFGPDIYRYRCPVSLTTFWKRHDEKRLRTNSLLRIVG